MTRGSSYKSLLSMNMKLKMHDIYPCRPTRDRLQLLLHLLVGTATAVSLAILSLDNACHQQQQQDCHVQLGLALLHRAGAGAGAGCAMLRAWCVLAAVHRQSQAQDCSQPSVARGGRHPADIRAHPGQAACCVHAGCVLQGHAAHHASLSGAVHHAHRFPPSWQLARSSLGAALELGKLLLCVHTLRAAEHCLATAGSVHGKRQQQGPLITYFIPYSLVSLHPFSAWWTQPCQAVNIH